MRIRVIVLASFIMLMVGCGSGYTASEEKDGDLFSQNVKSSEDFTGSSYTDFSGSVQEAERITDEITELETGLSAVKYEGDYGFENFLSDGGASSDRDVVKYISDNLLPDDVRLSFKDAGFGCSTISVKNKDGDSIFGRNFDWNTCNALIVHSVPHNGYSSISTVNMDFIDMSGLSSSALPDGLKAAIAMYAPLDGMNDKGLAVSVNMIQDYASISQNTGKPDITTTTAIRLLLNKAANVDEAVSLLGQYDMHASMSLMTHIAISDVSGRSVVVEYIDNEMKVVDTPVVTNFYLSEGKKYGIGTEQSHRRFEMLTEELNEKKTMSANEVRDALSKVSKKNFGEFESTEWSIIFNQSTGEAHYYHRENYDKRYVFSIK